MKITRQFAVNALVSSFLVVALSACGPRGTTNTDGEMAPQESPVLQAGGEVGGSAWNFVKAAGKGIADAASYAGTEVKKGFDKTQKKTPAAKSGNVPVIKAAQPKVKYNPAIAKPFTKDFG